jgi:anti-anti-sigma factor
MKNDVQVKTVGSQADIVQISIRGYLDTMAAYSLQEQVQGLITEGKYRYLIDLEDLEQVSSAGIGFFSGLVMELRKFQGHLVFVHIPEQVQHLFKITRLIELFTVCDDASSALAMLESLPDPAVA